LEVMGHKKDEIRKPFAHYKAKAKLENYEDEWRGRTCGHGDWVTTEIGRKAN
jgi:hypothetical protein